MKEKLLFAFAGVVATLITGMVVLLLVKHEVPELRDTTSLTINVCEPPYNAVPDDTISDIAAFQLAVDVIQSLKLENVFDSLDVRLIVPPGRYIFDESINGKGTKMDFMAEYPTFDISGAMARGGSISNMRINYRY